MANTSIPGPEGAANPQNRLIEASKAEARQAAKRRLDELDELDEFKETYGKKPDPNAQPVEPPPPRADGLVPNPQWAPGMIGVRQFILPVATHAAQQEQRRLDRAAAERAGVEQRRLARQDQAAASAAEAERQRLARIAASAGRIPGKM